MSGVHLRSKQLLQQQLDYNEQINPCLLNGHLNRLNNFHQIGKFKHNFTGGLRPWVGVEFWQSCTRMGTAELYSDGNRQVENSTATFAELKSSHQEEYCSPVGWDYSPFSHYFHYCSCSYCVLWSLSRYTCKEIAIRGIGTCFFGLHPGTNFVEWSLSSWSAH